MSESFSPVEVLSIKVDQQIDDLRDYWLGRILTLVDATYQDPEQRKAQKDLVKEIFWSNQSYYPSNIRNYFKMYAESLGEKYFNSKSITEEVSSENIFIKK